MMLAAAGALRGGALGWAAGPWAQPASGACASAANVLLEVASSSYGTSAQQGRLHSVSCSCCTCAGTAVRASGRPAAEASPSHASTSPISSPPHTTWSQPDIRHSHSPAGAGAVGMGRALRTAGCQSWPTSLSQTRHASMQPEAVVYAGPSSPNPKRVTLRTLKSKYEKGEPISMVTAYDYPSAVHVDGANIDILLVGDSVAMVVHGHDTTLPITMDEMIVHCKAVARGAKRAFLVGDMPFGSYETGVRDAVINATRMLKEGGMDAVKLEGGSPARVEAARAIVTAGVAVMGHVGLTPQSISVIGGFRPQAQVAEEALRVLQQAQALQDAGCFCIVLECVPGPIAAAVTKSLRIPTIGIGAGGQTSGQVLVYHDLLGMMSHPHHAKVTPKFCKQYAQVGNVIQAALQQYREEVVSRQFPSARFSPYRIPPAELSQLSQELRKQGASAAAQALEETAALEAAALGEMNKGDSGAQQK